MSTLKQHIATAKNWNRSFTHIAFKLEQLAKRIWCSIRLSGFQFSLLLNHFGYVRIPFHTAPKCDTQLIQYATLHFWDRRGAASLSYRNRVEITALICEQKHYTVWFSCRRKSIDYNVNTALDTAACIPVSPVHQKVSPRLFRYSPSLHCLISCVQRSSESSSS